MKFILFVLILSYINSFSQPLVQWQNCFGGTDGEDGWSLVSTFDGNFLVVGGSASNDGNVSGNHGGICGGGNCTDMWVLKVDSSGNLLWQKSFGGTGGDYGHSVIQTKDSGFLVTGVTTSFDGDVTGNHSSPGGYSDIWVVKIDSTGNLIWQQCYGGTDSEVGFTAIQTKDEGYLISGYTNSQNGQVAGNHGGYDSWVIKIDSVGALIWQKCLGGSSGEMSYSLLERPDSGYIVAGMGTSIDGDLTGHNSGSDYWLVWLDQIGDIQFWKTYGGTEGEKCYSLIKTNSNELVMAGFSSSSLGVTGSHGSFDFWIAKADSAGNLLDEICFGGSSIEVAYDIKETIDGGFIVIGYSILSNDGDVSGNQGYDWWILKLDHSLNMQWQKCLGGSSFEEAKSLTITNDDDFILAGTTASNNGDVLGNHGGEDIWVVKFKYPLTDAKLKHILYPTAVPLCDSTFSPVIQIQNNGRDPLTSVQINYQLDNGIVLSYQWNGLLPQDSLAIITLPSINSTPGNHELKVFLSAPNGIVDENNFNDTLIINFSIEIYIETVPIIEGFEDSTFLPNTWTFSYQYPLFYHDTLHGAFGNSSSSLLIPFFNVINSGNLFMQFPSVDLTQSISPVKLFFSIASARNNNASAQSLSIKVSTDCAISWNEIYLKANDSLATAGWHQSSFIPGHFQWRVDSVDLSSFVGQSNVKIRFDINVNQTNNMYFDDINLIDGTSHVTETKEFFINFISARYTSGKLKIKLHSSRNQALQLFLYDLTGKILSKKTTFLHNGINELELNAYLSNALYLVRLQSSDDSFVIKIPVCSE